MRMGNLSCSTDSGNVKISGTPTPDDPHIMQEEGFGLKSGGITILNSGWSGLRAKLVTKVGRQAGARSPRRVSASTLV